jgi:hypothetical protein
MARGTFLLDIVTHEPTSTDDLYTRVGYLRLAQHGLVPYPAFRKALAGLHAAGLLHCQTDEEGATLWRLSSSESIPPAAGLAD